VHAAYDSRQPLLHSTIIILLFTCYFLVTLLQSFGAYAKLRVERMNVRMAGIRAKRAKEAEAAEKDS
jgi:hypothetical protein